MSSYTEKETRRFNDIEEEILRKQRALRYNEDGSLRDKSLTDDNIVRDVVAKHFPSAAEKEEYMKWTLAQNRASRNMKKLYNPQDLIHTISCTNFIESQSLRSLFPFFRSAIHPYIPVGRHCGYRYRLDPGLSHFIVETEDIDFDDQREFATEPILGLEVSPKRIRYVDEKEDRLAVRRRDATDESYYTDSSGESIMGTNGNSGFVFFQIGTVKAAPESEWSNNGELPDGKYHTDLPWIQTDWVMVVVIDANCKAGSVWLLQQFDPIIEHTLDRYAIEPDELTWGWFLGDPAVNQRAGVKIADKIEDLTETHPWTMDEYIENKYVLVQAVLAERDEGLASIIVRQTPKAAPGTLPALRSMTIADDE
jgi:hypothetical protein